MLSGAFVVSLLTLVSTVSGLIGFDCNRATLNYTTIELNQVEPCKMAEDLPPLDKEIIQLIQLANSLKVKVKSCKILYKRHVTYCGWNSYSVEVEGGYGDYYLDIGRYECLVMHESHYYNFQGRYRLDDLAMNTTTTRMLVVAGSLTGGKECEGAWYSDKLGLWSNVVVQASLVIELHEKVVMSSPLKDEIQVSVTTKCQFGKGSCLDLWTGQNFWDPISLVGCDSKTHLVLSEGSADVSKDSNTDSFRTYFVCTPKWAFTPRTTREYMDCTSETYLTEHTKLLIVRKGSRPFQLPYVSLDTSQLDFMSYVNSKFVFMAKVQNEDVALMYKKLEFRRCLVEHKLLSSQMAIAKHHPIEFAYLHMGMPGYTGVVAGEVIYVVQYNPVEVSVRRVSQCFNELPVTYNNKSMFMTPRSHLLMSVGTELICNELAKPMFQIENSWVTLYPQPQIASSPIRLSPLQPGVWKNNKLAGIYTSEDLDKMRESLMFHGESAATLVTISSLVRGTTSDLQGLHVKSLIDEEMFEFLHRKTIDRVWGWFNWVGEFSTTVLGIYVVVRIAKFLLDTIVHGHILYNAFGFSFQLLGAICTSVTTLLLHREETRSSNAKDIPLSHMEETQVLTKEPSAPSNSEAMSPRYPVLPLHSPSPSLHISATRSCAHAHTNRFLQADRRAICLESTAFFLY